MFYHYRFYRLNVDIEDIPVIKMYDGFGKTTIAHRWHVKIFLILHSRQIYRVLMQKLPQAHATCLRESNHFCELTIFFEGACDGFRIFACARNLKIFFMSPLCRRTLVHWFLCFIILYDFLTYSTLMIKLQFRGIYRNHNARLSVSRMSVPPSVRILCPLYLSMDEFWSKLPQV